MGLYSRGFIIGRIFVSGIWGTYFRKGLFGLGGGGAYDRNFTVSEQFDEGQKRTLDHND